MTHDTDTLVLKAILFADLAQYSRLMVADEDAAVDLVTRCFEVFKDGCGAHHGEFVKSTGDGVLAIFDSVSDALDYALDVQEALAKIATVNPAAGRFRIGLHMGDVHRRAGDVYGHAVNLAARLQTLAVPGEVCATQEVYQAARGISRFAFRFGGRKALKNMPETVAIYQVVRRTESQLVPQPSLSVMVMGGFACLDAQGEQVIIKSKAVQALIGYLSLSAGFRESRDRVATLLWPESPPAEANAALSNCLRIAKKTLADGLHGADLRRGAYLNLDPARISVDVHRILSELNEGKIDDTLLQRPDWPEAILYGFDSVSSFYGAWLKVTRHNRRELAQEALEHLLDLFDSREAIVKRATTAILNLEPSHEGAARCLMRHYAASHNAAAALRVYKALCRTLHEQYGLEPNAETSALAASLLEPVQSKKLKRVSDSRAPTIAIGTFTTASESFAAHALGFRAELITNLSKFRELTIVDLRSESDSSGLDYVLTAEYRQVDVEAWLSATLTETAHRRVVWSDSYRLSLANWLNVQKQLVGRIASNVEIYLSQDRLSRALPRLPEDLGVYDAWLRGEHLLLRWSAQSEDEAERLFERTIAEDPNFAPAYASLASVYNSRQFIRPGLPSRPKSQERALELAQRAVELDPLDARNLMAVAYSAAMVKRYEQSELHFELASQLNPNDPKVVVSAALGLAYMGRIGLSQELLDHTTSLTTMFPAYLWSHIATIRFFVGDYAGAVEAADRSQNLIIDTPGWKAAALGKLGRVDEQRIAIEQLMQAVSAAWAGPSNPSRENIIDWFLGVFPIRNDSDRLSLATSLRSQ